LLGQGQNSPEALLHPYQAGLYGLNQALHSAFLPVVLNRGEMQAILLRLTGMQGLIASLLYGTGMMIMGCLRLRVVIRTMQELLGHAYFRR
jgi:hypothetical protein